MVTKIVFLPLQNYFWDKGKQWECRKAVDILRHKWYCCVKTFKMHRQESKISLRTPTFCAVMYVFGVSTHVGVSTSGLDVVAWSLSYSQWSSWLWHTHQGNSPLVSGFSNSNHCVKYSLNSLFPKFSRSWLTKVNKKYSDSGDFIYPSAVVIIFPNNMQIQKNKTYRQTTSAN